MKKQLLIITFLAFLMHVSAQVHTFPPSAKDTTKGRTSEEMVVYDRLGNPIFVSDLRFPKQQGGGGVSVMTIPPTCNAGIFRLTFADAGTGTGFDDPTLGPTRQAIACQVFTDLSGLINAAPSPYTSIPNLGTSPSFVEINVQSSLNSSSNPTLGTAGQYFITSPGDGIVYGSVWQTINSGIDCWFGTNASNLGNFGTFHGQMQINFGHPFYLGANPTLIPATDYDLYTVILHEAIHALGFGSLINQNGTSKITSTNPGIYSIYDTYLTTSTGTPLITASGCYNASFNNAFVSTLTTSCAVRFTGTTNTYVSSDPTWSSGTSLSHYPIAQCGNPGNYDMNPSLATGVTRRAPDPAEVTTLCDLGYSTTGTYVATNYPGGICGIRVGGVNDYATYTTSAPGTNYTTPNNTAFTFSSTDILGNDENASYYECLEVVNASGTITAGLLQGGTGNNITFTPNTGFAGVAILRYVPRVNATGRRGNTTYIFIMVMPPPLPACVPNQCNLICYGGFEEFTSQLQYDLYTLGSMAAGTGNTFVFNPATYPDNSPDLNTSGFMPASVVACGTPFNVINAFAGNQYVGMILRNDPFTLNNNPEGPSIPLSAPVLPGEIVTINLWARLADANCNGGVEVRLTNMAPCTGNTLLASCTGLIQTTPLASGALANTTAWQSITIAITNTTTANMTHLLINSLSYGPYNSAPYGFIYIDEVSATKNTANISITKTAPASACPGDIITYSITVCNTSTFTAPNVVINDVLSAGLTPVAGGTFTYPTHTIAALTAGQCTTLTLNAQVTASFGTVSNTANVQSGGCLSNTTTNTATTSINNQTLNIVTTPSNTNPTSGSTINVDVTICNTTSVTVTGIQAQTTFPTGYVVTPGSGYTIVGNTVVFNPFTLGPGTITSPACTTLTFPVTVSCPGGNTNGQFCSSLTSGGSVCLNSNNSCANITVNCGCNCALTLSGTISTSPVGHQVYCINSNISISGAVNFTWSEFQIAPNVVITVLPGATLTIEGSHLYSCTDMWSGINVQNGGRLNIVPFNFIFNIKIYPLIEDAFTAVTVAGSTLTTNILNVNGATFNRNQTGISIVGYTQTASTTYPFTIQNSAFTCRNLVFTPGSIVWPQTPAVKAATNPITSPLQTPYIHNGTYSQTGTAAFLKAPFAPGTQKSLTGILLRTVGVTVNAQASPYPTAAPVYYEIKIGNSGGFKNPNYNIFDNQITCIDAFNANFTCVNNIFQNTITFGKGGGSGGIGINAVAEQKNVRMQIIPGGANNTYYNKFFNCSRSITSRNYFEHNITYCDVRSTQVNPAPAMTLNTPGKFGFTLTTNRFRLMNVSNNSLYNIENAIIFNANYGPVAVGTFVSSSGQYSGQVDINKNFIAPHLPGNPISTQYVSNAIRVENVIPAGPLNVLASTTSPFQTTVNINNNDINYVYRGIFCSNWQKKNVNTISNGYNTGTGNPIIIVPDPFFGSPMQFGVNHSNNIAATPYGNNIYYNIVKGYGTTNPQLHGIYTSLCQNQYLHCNTTTNTYNGIIFEGPETPTSTRLNTMNTNNYGFVLSNNGIIGTQGTSSAPADNMWSGTWSANPLITPNKTATISSSASTSPMWVRNSALFNPNGSGTTSPISGLGADDYFYSGTNALPGTIWYSSVTQPSLGCPVLINTGGGGNGGSPNTANAISVLEQIAQDQIPFSSHVPEKRFIAKNQLFRAIQADNTLMSNSPILQNFYTQSQSATRGLFTEIEDAISNADIITAQSKTNSISGQNIIENNYKTFYSVYLNYLNDTIISSGDSLNLVNLANGCPFTDGAVVYQARTLYNSAFNTIELFADNCNSTNGSKFSKTVSVAADELFDVFIYPNPSSDVVYISPFNLSEGKLQVQMKDINGKTILNKNLQVNEGIANFNINHLDNGVYFIHILNISTGETTIKKLVVQK